MRVVVLGSGLIAATTAYYLRDQGAEVVVLDLGSGVAGGSMRHEPGSGLMSPGRAASIIAPGAAGRLVAGLLLPGAVPSLRWRAMPGLLPWGARVLRGTATARFTQNLLHSARLGLYSQYEYHKLVVSQGLQFEHNPLGSLQLFRSRGLLSQAVAQAHFLKQVDVDHVQLSVEELVAKEPALAPIAHRLTGAIQFPDDETGNAEEFLHSLKTLSVAAGVEFVQAPGPLVVDAAGWRKRRRITSVSANGNDLAADAYVVAADGQSSTIARQLGVRLPLVNMTSYQIRLALNGFAGSSVVAPQHPVVDMDSDTVAIPLQAAGVLQLTGLAEFAGDSHQHDLRRASRMHQRLARLYPGHGLEPTDIKSQVYSLQQSTTADGLPIVGGTPVENVFVNAGHGAGDWTMACGCGAMVAAQVMQALGNWQLPKTLRAMDLGPFTYRRR